VIGIKDSSGDMTSMLRMIRTIRPQRPEFAFLSGWETTLAPMLAIGCDGGVNATSGVIPDYMCKMFSLVESGDFAQAQQMQLAMLDLFEASVLAADFPHGIRTAVALRGFNIGRSRQPQGEAQCGRWPDIEKRIEKELLKLGYPVA
jgi:4-hydroxy-tetrahydrodipicolinate synthase